MGGGRAVFRDDPHLVAGDAGAPENVLGLVVLAPLLVGGEFFVDRLFLWLWLVVVDCYGGVGLVAGLIGRGERHLVRTLAEHQHDAPVSVVVLIGDVRTGCDLGARFDPTFENNLFPIEVLAVLGEKDDEIGRIIVRHLVRFLFFLVLVLSGRCGLVDLILVLGRGSRFIDFFFDRFRCGRSDLQRFAHTRVLVWRARRPGSNLSESGSRQQDERECRGEDRQRSLVQHMTPKVILCGCPVHPNLLRTPCASARLPPVSNTAESGFYGHSQQYVVWESEKVYRKSEEWA